MCRNDSEDFFEKFCWEQLLQLTSCLPAPALVTLASTSALLMFKSCARTKAKQTSNNHTKYMFFLARQHFNLVQFWRVRRGGSTLTLVRFEKRLLETRRD